MYWLAQFKNPEDLDSDFIVGLYLSEESAKHAVARSILWDKNTFPNDLERYEQDEYCYHITCVEKPEC